MRFAFAAAAFVVSHAAFAQGFPATLEEAGKAFDPTQPVPTTPVVPVLPPTTTTTTTPPTTTTTTTAKLNEPHTVDGWALVEARSERRSPDGKPTADACGYERDVVVERMKEGRKQMTPAVLVVPCAKGPDGLPTPGMPSLKLPAPYGAPAGAMVAAAADIEVGVTGALPLDDVVAVVLAHRAELDGCHAAGKGGQLVMRIVVNAAGVAVEAAGQSGVLKGTAVERCVSKAVRAWAFSQPGDGRPAVVALAVTYGDKGGELAAGAPKLGRTCNAGELPKAPAQLAEGEVACLPPSKPKKARACAHDEVPKAAEDLAEGELACKPEASERGVPFLKGELTNLGDVQLVNSRSSFGVGIGAAVIDSVYYAVLRPDLNLRFGDFSLGLGAPLRFELANLGEIDFVNGDPVNDIFGNAGRFRSQDWDQLEDFLKPLRYLTYGKKEDRLYIDINRVHATTIGHGQLVRRYAPNIDIDEDNLFAQVDGYGDYGGVEVMAGPFPLPRLIGGLVFVKPMGIAGAFTTLTDDGTYLDMLADSWSIGASYVTDLNTPTGLEGQFNPADQRFQLAVDSTNQLVWRNKANPVGDVVQGIGFDTEIKVLKLANVDVKMYGDYSHLFFPADSSSAQAFGAFSGGGATIGSLLRVSVGTKPVRNIDDEDDETKAGRKPREKKAAHAFRVRLEGRTFAPTYLPSYWNTMYEIDRFQFGFGGNRSLLPTKIGYLAGQTEDAWRAGYFLEASYEWVDAVGVTAAFEDAYPIGGEPDEVLRAKNFALHVESQGLGWLQLFASYHYRNFDSAEFDQIFSFNTDNELLFAGVRLQVLPIMFINFAAQRSFRLGFAKDDSPGQVDDKGQRFSSVGLENVWAGGFDVELGWQF